MGESFSIQSIPTQLKPYSSYLIDAEKKGNDNKEFDLDSEAQTAVAKCEAQTNQENCENLVTGLRIRQFDLRIKKENSFSFSMWEPNSLYFPRDLASKLKDILNISDKAERLRAIKLINPEIVRRANNREHATSMISAIAQAGFFEEAFIIASENFTSSFLGSIASSMTHLRLNKDQVASLSQKALAMAQTIEPHWDKSSAISDITSAMAKVGLFDEALTAACSTIDYGSVPKAKIPTEFFDGIKHLFVDETASSLEFKPNITRDDYPEANPATIKLTSVLDSFHYGHWDFVAFRNIVASMTIAGLSKEEINKRFRDAGCQDQKLAKDYTMTALGRVGVSFEIGMGWSKPLEEGWKPGTLSLGARIDVGLSERFKLGGFFSYEFLFSEAHSDGGADSGNSIRFGLMPSYNIFRWDQHDFDFDDIDAAKYMASGVSLGLVLGADYLTYNNNEQNAFIKSKSEYDAFLLGANIDIGIDLKLGLHLSLSLRYLHSIAKDFNRPSFSAVVGLGLFNGEWAN